MKSKFSIFIEDLMMVMLAIIVFILWLASEQNLSLPFFLLHM